MSVSFVMVGSICCLIGYAIGWFIARKAFKPKSAGYLLYNNEDENEDPYLFLDLDIDPEQIMKEKYVVFTIKEVVTSQK